MRAAAIAGATGLTGQQVMNRLLDDGSFNPVVAILRKPMRRAHPRLLERVTGFQSLDSLPPSALDVAFCCLGTTIRKAGSQQAFREVDHDYIMAFARWAKANGARHFLVVSSVGADAKSANFYLRVKGETEDSLAAVGFEWLDIFRPSMLLGPRAERRPLERAGQWAAKAFSWLFIGPLERYRGIPAAAVADAMLARARAPGEPGIRRFEWRELLSLAGQLRG